MDEIIRGQSSVIKELEKKIEFLSSKLDEKHQLNPQQKSGNSKSKILIVGSSLNRNLHQEVIRNVTNSDVTFSEAFTVDKDKNARFPEKNLLNVVPNELTKKNFNV